MCTGSGGISIIATIFLQLSLAWCFYTSEVNIYVYLSEVWSGHNGSLVNIRYNIILNRSNVIVAAVECRMFLKYPTTYSKYPLTASPKQSTGYYEVNHFIHICIVT